jgi:hypothetical protein
MNPDNSPSTPPVSQSKTWLQQTFTADYFKRVAFSLTLCLVIYMAYLMKNRGAVDFLALGVFVLMSFLTQLFFNTPQKNKIY